ncbi:phosphopantetheine-binding protein [Vibrio sp. PP-XX7]
MNISTPIDSLGDKLERFILPMIAEYTQYNIADLNPACHLENDLGIDSVSLVEMMAEISQQLNLSGPLSANGIHAISDILRVIAQQAEAGTLAMTDLESHQSQSTTSVAVQFIRDQVCAIFALHSGYSESDLDLDAHYEE